MDYYTCECGGLVEFGEIVCPHCGKDIFKKEYRVKHIGKITIFLFLWMFFSPAFIHLHDEQVLSAIIVSISPLIAFYIYYIKQKLKFIEKEDYKRYRFDYMRNLWQNGDKNLDKYFFKDTD